ncbi:hypothetical protein PHSY_001126 [Pseudozyma hubeiensis SY62]|uniref:Uncharacterized protein n=1 Tax=Pseudozyma hubeiensis (strain SY62) TaxID=1305764 RepID=R9NY41_PSEHS|nr:hypothetical protein PHSY_001126 [Pseudozyma hubeiensis SY62]GAC93561.1 hypothetical protein PHSY_001126 [Pseudozyma hubeiensis SY62]
MVSLSRKAVWREVLYEIALQGPNFLNSHDSRLVFESNVDQPCLHRATPTSISSRIHRRHFRSTQSQHGQATIKIIDSHEAGFNNDDDGFRATVLGCIFKNDIGVGKAGQAKARTYRHDEPQAPPADAFASPKASRKRRIVLVQRKNPLDLRSSSPASPDLRLQTMGLLPAPDPAAARSVSVRTAGNASRNEARQLLQLERNDTSSPIGTFGGQNLGRSSRGLRSGSSEQAVRLSNGKTVGLPTLKRSCRLRAGTRERRVPTSDSGAPHNENVDAYQAQDHAKSKTAKRDAEEALVRPRRRRAKIQRVELGGGLPSSSADQPLSDADHHLNSQPDADHCAADESEISYFPTLRPARSSDARTRHTSSDERNDVSPFPQQDAAKHPILFTGQGTWPTLASHHTRSEVPVPQHEIAVGCAAERPEEADLSVGLFEVLSQSALRKVDGAQSGQAASVPQVTFASAEVRSESVASAEAQHHIEVEYDPSRASRHQAQYIAMSLVERTVDLQKWSAVHPDSIHERLTSRMRSSESGRMLQAAFRPPSAAVVSRDIGLSSSQMQKKPLEEEIEFVHHCSTHAVQSASGDDDDRLKPFEHRLRYAGYHQCCSNSSVYNVRTIGCLRPFDESAFSKRIQLPRKEVVKVIIPFSEPSFSNHATRARFLTPHATSTSHPPHPRHSPSDDNKPLLVWMQSTAQTFFRALESMIHTNSSPHTHDSSVSRSDLYPCPILSYAAHADAGEGASHVALYVHLDRLEEARQRLADVELSTGGGSSCRPFADGDVRLFVTSLRGKPLCLI